MLLNLIKPTGLVIVCSFLTVFAQTAQKEVPNAGLGSLIPMMLVMFAVVYFLMIRPEQKKQKERQQMLGSIKKGDRVLTVAGILGTVVNYKEKEGIFQVKIAEDTIVDFTKSAITTVLNKDGTEKQLEQNKEEKEKK
ncbi:MAG: preprotein translocase subunit YajC [Chitinispirillaceae bacterium]|nr:preprotein translocase subunit YajC [Chitinispirillaceae bacterium]